MIPKYFDIHSHIQFPQFSKDKNEVLQRMEENEVGALIVGVDAKSSELAIKEVAEKENLFATVGLHPNDVFKESFNVEQYTELARHKKIVAIGECGLDHFRIKNQELRIKQKDILEKHIALAVLLNKPLMIHCRDAHDDLIDILQSKKNEHGEKLRGNIHFFTGTKEIAKKYFDLDFTISFTGVLTFTHEYDEVVKYAPLNMIMSETDCPFAAPVPYRGQRNEPVYVVEVVKKIAEIRREDFEKVRNALISNVFRCFKI
ncbi:MAG: TatD family hydrolase [Parcubacteria group bacterium]|nr:TatD family hydrolase [Parcubacteria group bacterium]